VVPASPTAWIRALRPPKRPVDPLRPIAAFWERERTAAGEAGDGGSGEIPALTLLLAGAECPFTCVFCDLWRETLDGPTPPGALVAQLSTALAEAGPLPRPAAVKLVGERCLAFASRLAGRLEVAMGLETVHEPALAQLNKGMTLADFDRAAGTLERAGIALRAFVLVGAPFVPPEEAVDWAVRSAAHAFSRGAARVSLIPVREGNGALEDLREAGEWTPPTLAQLEEALERCQSGEGAGTPGIAGIVTADLWDARRFAACPECVEARLARLDRMNRSGAPEPRPACGLCGGA
jgi:archaeosine synthase beta-subunit